MPSVEDGITAGHKWGNHHVYNPSVCNDSRKLEKGWIFHRMVRAVNVAGGGEEWYGYDPENRRLANGEEQIDFYDLSGRRVETWRFVPTSWPRWQLASTNVYFAGRLIASGGKAVAVGSWFFHGALDKKQLIAEAIETRRDVVLYGSALQRHTKLNLELRQQTGEALRNPSAECQRAITNRGVNLSTVAEVAATTEYFNVEYEGGYRVRDISGDVNPVNASEDLTSYLGSARAAVLPDASGRGISNVVVLGSRFFQGSVLWLELTASQNLTLIHEALHTGTR